MLNFFLRQYIGTWFVTSGDALSGQDVSFTPFSRGDYSEGIDFSSGDQQSDMARFLSSTLVGNSVTIGWVFGELIGNPASRLPFSTAPIGVVGASVALVGASAVGSKLIVETTYSHGGKPHLTSFTGQMSGKYFDY